jgi:hypothetical protein
MMPITPEHRKAHNAALRHVLDSLEIQVDDGWAIIETSRGNERVDLTATRPDAAVKQLIRVASSRGYLAGQKQQRDRTLHALGATPTIIND